MTTTFALNAIRLFDNGNQVDNAMLVVRQGRIHYTGPALGSALPADIPVIDGSGWSVSPGLIDLQFNGGYGRDFTQDPTSLLEVARRLPETGVVAFLPTFITSPIDSYANKLSQIVAAQRIQNEQADTGARILGAHVEGPFLSPAKKGAHRQDWFIDPSPAALAQLQPLEAIRILTLAPEREQGLEAVRWLHRQGIVVSIGHSAAGMEETLSAIQAGATLATHLYNAMRAMEHRDPGLVGTLLTHEDIRVGLIVDGIHVHPQMVRLAYRCLGPERIVLVTDAMAAMGMPPGEYVIGDQKVFVADSSARLADGTLAGSILSLDQGVRNMIAYTGCSPAQALRMATSTPAETLGLADEMGRLCAGYPANLVLLDSSLNVSATLIDGRLAYASPEASERFSRVSPAQST